MSIINSQPLIGASGQGGGYNLTNSLRFRSSATAYLSRTPASAGNRQTWTYSAWVKRGAVNAEATLLSGGATTGRLAVFFDSTGKLVSDVGGTGTFDESTAVYRDPSAWYHFVWQFDTTQATAANRSRMYINGVQVSLTNTRTFSQNTNYEINNSSLQTVGTLSNSLGGYNLDGYLAEVNFIDGQALTPSSFGETSSTTGVWIPKKYTGTYGTNGFYLPFTNTASTSTLGNDFSGNSNTWTVNNISLTAGSTYDSMTDVPTLTSATAGNYCVLNPLDNPSASNSLANANLTPSTAGSSGWQGIRSTIAFPTTGKWYYEVTLTSGTTNIFLGIVTKDASGTYHDDANTFAVKMSDCSLRPSGATATGTQASYAVGDVFGVAIDCSTPTVQFYKNGSLNVTYTSPSFDPSKTYFPCFMGNDTGASATHNYNFGQRPFTYTAPANYLALNTFNLPTPTIGATASTTANKYMNVNLWTGDGSSSRNITGIGFAPDFVWIKNRANGTRFHVLNDTVRGANKQLFSNNTNAEETDTTQLTAFGSDGFTIGNNANVNENTSGIVSWNWRANGAGSTNTAGSINSTVSVNAAAGFSIVTYTGNGSNATIGHGLGVAPSMIIRKARNASLQSNWYVYHSSLSANGTVFLNLTDAYFASANYWNNTAPTSSVFTVGSATNVLNDTWVAYCFAQIAGYSAFGKYTGNASDDGTFVFTGFRPRFLMVKRTDTTSDWVVIDSARNPYNAAGTFLYPNLSNAEDVTTRIDFVSNGFKLRTTAGPNNSGSTWIYMAVAESPFKYANAR